MSVWHMAQSRRKGDDEALCGAEVRENLVWSRSTVTCWRCAHLVLGRPLPAEPAVPEHGKLEAVKHEGRDATQLVGEFLEWLADKDGGNIVLARERDDRLSYAGDRKEALLAGFFGINENALEAEKMALLTYQRAVNAAVEWFEKEGRPYLRDDP